MMTLMCEFDDYPIRADRTMDLLEKLKESHPGLKITMFAIPALMTEEAWKRVDKDWIQIGIHGYDHSKGEMRKDKIFSEQHHIDKLAAIMKDPRWQRIIKPPHYGYGHSVLGACSKLGLAVSIRKRGDVYTKFTSLDKVPELKAYIKYERSENERWFSHPAGIPQLFQQKTQDQFVAKYAACEGRCAFLMDTLDRALHKVYLGAGVHTVPGFENYDIKQCTPDTVIWKWNDPIRLPDNSCSEILIQQSIMYCNKDNYVDNLKECRRVLAPGGRVLIKEDNNKVRIWRQPGYNRHGGLVQSNTNREELEQLLVASGFVVAPDTPVQLLHAHPGYFNRGVMVRSGECFIVKGIALKEEVVYKY